MGGENMEETFCILWTWISLWWDTKSW